MMSKAGESPEAAFERRFAALLNEYAAVADWPFDANQVAGTAALGGPRRRNLMPFRAAFVPLLIACLAVAAIAGALVAARLLRPEPPPVPFAPDEVLVNILTDRREGRTDVVAVSAGDGELRPISVDGIVLSISPDRTRFVATGVDASLTVISAHGDAIAQVTREATRATWSPDGRRLLITSVWSGPEYALWDLETNAIRRLPISPYVPSAAAGGVTLTWIKERLGLTSWAPDGRHVLLPTQGGLVVADLDGVRVRPIPGTTRDSVGYWSPTGDRILHENREDGYLAMLSVDADFATEVLEVLSTGSPRFPEWSPDALEIAFITDDSLVVADRDNLAGARVVLRENVRDASYPRWSPDSKQLAFLARGIFGDPGFAGLYVVSREGGNARVVLAPFHADGSESFDW
jgi:Tol biopolymer transport system component